MTASTTQPPALDAASVAAVVRAAAEGRAVVVPHGLQADAVGDNAALREIAASLPQSWWRACDGAVDEIATAPPRQKQRLLPGDDDGSIVTRLYHLQRLPSMRPLINSVYDELEKAWPSTEPWLRRDAGFFLSSAGAVTSAHADRHHNLLLQLSGSKEIGLGLPGSRAHAAAIARSTPSLACCTMPPGAEVIRLPAGSALYMPPFTVHWVRSTEESLALSCGWNSAATERMGEVHEANGALMRLGLPAQPVGHRSDDLKVRTVSVARRLRRSRQPA